MKHYFKIGASYSLGIIPHFIWIPLGVLCKICDKHLCYFCMGVSPPLEWFKQYGRRKCYMREVSGTFPNLKVLTLVGHF